MEFQQVQYTIDTLVQKIRAGRLALPDFQRDFVWNPSRVVELLDSVARQWPIGSLLLLSGPQPFAIREIDSSPKIDDDELDLYILDGQQRVTSLYHAIANVSEFVYYVNFDSLANGSDEYISWERRRIFESQYAQLEDRARAKIALIRDVWDSEAFYSWLSHLEDEKEKIDFLSLRERKLPGLHAKVYKVLAIVLEQSIELEALARIFETLNRTGVALNAFDLMVAALYPTGFRLRDEWDRAAASYPIFDRVTPDELEPLKLLALLVRAKYGKRAARGVRQGDLLRLDRTHFAQMWNEVIDLYAKALDYCRSEFGVVSTDLMPSWAMVLGIAGWLAFPPANPRFVRAWWIDRLFDQFFAQASNTRIVADFDAIMVGALIERVPQAVPFEVVLQRPAKTNGMLMRGMGALLVRYGAIDLLTGKSLAEAKGFAFRTVTSDGMLKRPSATDPLLSIVVLSQESDRHLGTAARIDGLETSAVYALASQGIDVRSYRRDQSFISNLLLGI